MKYNRIIVTGHEGKEHGEVAGVTLPLLRDYARRHDCGFVDYPLPASVGRPSSWKKLIAVSAGLAVAEEVLWVDSDVVVVHPDENIFDTVPGHAWHAMVRHQTNEGDVPNAGVWLVRRPMLSILMHAAMMDQFTWHRWWEQAALLSFMGFTEGDDGRVRLEEAGRLYSATHWLDESWNVCRFSPPEIRTKFFHACGLPHGPRMDAIRMAAGV